jgi:parallel beta-helix repeat protein
MLRSKRFLTTIAAVFLTAAVTFSGPGARADVIFVSGDVYGEWNADSVIVTDSVCVPAGETLTIMPGVEVLFTGYYSFDVVDGAVLHAVGTESDPIAFLPFTQGERTLGLDFMNASDQSILEYCHISDALTSGVHLENSNITIRNCLIEGGEAPTGVEGGGAIEILSGSNALIENNMLTDNYSAAYGGALYIDNSSPVVMGNTIVDNLAGYYGTAGGGGIAVFGSSNPVISFNYVSGNEVHPSSSFFVRNGYGGGIYYMGDSGGLISNNIITNNLVDWEPQTETYGGGLYIQGASPQVENNVIAHNEAQSNNGGGIFMYYSNSVFINNTVAYNTAGDFGGAVYSENSNPTFINSILYFNQDSTGNEIWTENSDVTVFYSDVQGGWQGQGNIDVDPMFRDHENGDFHLMSIECGDAYDSPAIDAGDPSIFDEYLHCDAGLGTEISDMGAYGGQGIPTGVDDTEEGIIPNALSLSQNYPNPFNASTVISYQLPEVSVVTLDIYDMLGRKVETLVDSQTHSSGEHQITWDASDYSSGMYFYRLDVNGYSGTSKMLLLK